MSPDTQLVYDDESHELLIAKGNVIGGTFTILGPLVTPVALMDYRGERVLASDGALHVVEASGLPTYGANAAGQDAWTLLCTLPRECHYCHGAVGANGAQLSFDGASVHLTIPANVERLFPGLLIPAGSRVYSRNLTPGANYANLYVSVY